MRTKKLYVLVPLTSLLFFVVLASMPAVIWPHKLHQSPSLPELMRSLLLGASLWCFSHCLRARTFTLICSSSFTILFFSNVQERRHVQHWVALWARYILAAFFVTLQEVLRLTSFYILDIHWSPVCDSPHPGKHGEGQMHVHDRTFGILWFLALGWSLAEVCTAIGEDYDHLALYSSVEPVLDSGLDMAERGLPVSDDGGSLENVVLSRVNMPDVDDLDLEDTSISRVMGGEVTNGEDSNASMPIARHGVKARKSLERYLRLQIAYGDQVPVLSIAVVQRINSVLLSLGITLILGFAHLSDQSCARASPPLDVVEFLSLGDRDHSIERIHSHWNALPPAFIVLTTIRVFLVVLRLRSVMKHCAAYITFLVSLGLVFTGVGMWEGLLCIVCSVNCSISF